METELTNPITEHAAQMAAVPDEAADIASKLVEQVVSGHLDSALEAVERGDGAFEDYSPHPISIEGDARAIVAAVTPVLVAAVLALHKPERRYTFGDAGYSCATKRDAAEVFEVSFNEIEHFDICAHCGEIEMAEGCDHDYKESLWPCATAKAAGVAEVSR